METSLHRRGQGVKIDVLRGVVILYCNGERVEGVHLPNPDGEIGVARGAHFTSFRVRRLHGEYKILGLSHHFARLAAAHKELGDAALRFPTEESLRHTLDRALSDFYQQGTDTASRVRISFWKSFWTLTVSPTPEITYPGSTLSLGSVDGYRTLEPHFKSVAMAAVSDRLNRKAHAAGFDEALMVDELGHVTEAGWGCVVLLRDSGQVQLPHRSILPGIGLEVFLSRIAPRCGFTESSTDQILAEELAVEEGTVLYLNSVRGVLEVTSIDGHQRPRTEKFREIFDLYWSEKFWEGDALRLGTTRAPCDAG